LLKDFLNRNPQLIAQYGGKHACNQSDISDDGKHHKRRMKKKHPEIYQKDIDTKNKFDFPTLSKEQELALQQREEQERIVLKEEQQLRDEKQKQDELRKQKKRQDKLEKKLKEKEDLD